MVQASRRTVFHLFAASGLAAVTTRESVAEPSWTPPNAPTNVSACERLSMPRGQISFRDRDLRLFNARGTTSFRSRTVTGLKAMIFVPFNMSDPQVQPPLSLSDSGHFNLSFREERTGTLIQDIQDEFFDPLYLNQKIHSDNTLGPHFAEQKSTLLLLYQDGEWSPETFKRRGTYHRREGGELISFGIESAVYLSDTADEIYFELMIENRLDRPLVLTAIPDQPRSGVKREACFVRPEGNFFIEIVCDSGPNTEEGWRLETPPNETQTYRFALLIKSTGSPVELSHQRTNLASDIQASKTASARLLEMSAERLPTIKSNCAAFDEFYDRSVLSVLLCRRDRENYIVRPFYDLGFSRGGATPWDMAFSSSLLAQLDPSGMRAMLLAFFASGSALEASWLSWEGHPSGWYAQTPFSLHQMVCDYMRYTGDQTLLDAQAGNTTIFESLKAAADALVSGYLNVDGLLDVGAGTGKVLEIRTDGYQHIVPTINALAADFFEAISELCRLRRIPNWEQYQKVASTIKAGIADTLWNEPAGWYDTLYPDGTANTVFSYHVFDMLGTRAIDSKRKQRLVEHLTDDEFLAPFGMMSISKADRIHFDREDCDWGGGGQYVGQPLKIVGNLFRMGAASTSWNLLKRCIRWTERFPYFPQTIYGDVLELQPHQVDWPLQLSAGAGAQAIINGVFGFQPQDDGSIIIAPNYDSSLGVAEMTNCHFRGHNYRVRISPRFFEVWRDGKAIKRSAYRPFVIHAS